MTRAKRIHMKFHNPEPWELANLVGQWLQHNPLVIYRGIVMIFRAKFGSRLVLLLKRDLVPNLDEAFLNLTPAILLF
jgi:hypothetical protein